MRDVQESPYAVDFQMECTTQLPVPLTVISDWISFTLENHQKKAELTLRLVESQEITELNSLYRQKNKATNVLAFPADIPPFIDLDYPFLGDIIICPAVVEEESIEQKLPFKEHFAHIVVHGTLHLLGFDHIKKEDATRMEKEEIRILKALGFANPYRDEAIYNEDFTH